MRCLSHLRLTYNTYNFMCRMISVLPKTKTKWPWLNLNCWQGVQWPEHQTIPHDLSCLLMSSQRERESRTCRLVQTFEGIKATGQVQTGQPLWLNSTTSSFVKSLNDTPPSPELWTATTDLIWFLPRYMCMGYWPSLFGQDGWILTKFFFFACMFMDWDEVLFHKHAKQTENEAKIQSSWKNKLSQ